MSMPGPDLKAVAAGGGRYEMKSNFMSGLWQVQLTISTPGEAVQETTIDVEVP
jgi:hypothetical protein